MPSRAMLKPALAGSFVNLMSRDAGRNERPCCDAAERPRRTVIRENRSIKWRKENIGANNKRQSFWPNATSGQDKQRPRKRCSWRRIHTRAHTFFSAI
jgi:hypothetical protein